METYKPNRRLVLKVSIEEKLIYRIVNLTASRLANLYGSCIQEMTQNVEYRKAFEKAKKVYDKKLHKVDQMVQVIHTDIRGEQVKYRKFNNYNTLADAEK